MIIVDALTNLALLHLIAEKIDRKGEEVYLYGCIIEIAKHGCGHIEHALDGALEQPDTWPDLAKAVDLLKGQWLDKGPEAMIHLQEMMEA